MQRSHSELNPSPLIDLKAELSKKYDAFKRAKLEQCLEPTKKTPLKNKGAVLPKKEKKDPILKITDDPNEEELALQKSRLALEAKAKLYEQITSNKILIDDEQNDLYLVDFQRKVLYEDKNTLNKIEEQAEFQNNVEKDFESDIGLNQKKSDFRQSSIKNFTTTHNQDTEISREGETSHSVHYQDILHNEVRDHGTGYFAFSTDEGKRKEQMDELNSLRQETENQRQTKERLQKKRTAMLQARLAKVCERRNINKQVIEEFTPKNDVEIPDEATNIKQEDVEKIPLPEIKPEASEVKLPEVRPWDVGKPELLLHPPAKRKMKTQNEWVEERRSERHSEFAPPSFYINN